ncbi:MAG TPA: HyuE hydantoin racemase, partial [Gammaproteobacteria bacterium]|nr:HyuE hydantoin racemase [Gammaproteobacteria bacterium]
MKSLSTVCFINPNSTVSMTDTCRHTFDRIGLGSSPKFEFVTNDKGPAAIQGARDGEVATEAMLELAARLPDHYGAFVVGCFDDTGVERLLDKVKRPVIGIGQAAYHWASLLSQRFVVLTTLEVSVPVIRESIRRQGFDSQCIDVIASGIPVLELERQPRDALNILDDLVGANVDSH